MMRANLAQPRVFLHPEMPFLPPALPPPDTVALAHSAQLTALIRARIAEAGGWLAFADYMELALYAPGLGYYAAGATKFGAAGDFVTAPELTPLFGQTLATTLAAVLAEVGGDCLELGAGSGRLAAAVLPELARLGQLPEHYAILELSADLRERQRAFLAATIPELVGRVVWLDALPEHFTGGIFGNEVLDATPVQRVRWAGEGLFVQGVVWQGERFVVAERPLISGPVFTAAQALMVAPGVTSEIGLAARGLMQTLAERLVAGAVVWVDYGFPQAEFYHPQRADGTLMCHYRHHSHVDPFVWPGLNDITAHVDFSAIATVAEAAGLAVLGYAPQAAYLLEAGVLDRLQTMDTGCADYFPVVSAVQKLLQPHEMGELFKVLAVGRGVSTPLPGFGGRGDRRHAL